MSNNLRQIAKDLRSFVKRCKDVHYSDSLLITFLVTGLLTIVPRTLTADVITEQQEVTAQTYDTITDLRQSFLRARKENEQSLKGAERELAMLLQQGEQVIKSPWASFQFGTGFTNNDWGTTYRGRGGKFLEYYRRNNDLTKYVFDANKHLYGATNLNMPRNQEPNSLTINPANVHEPYIPAVPTAFNTIDVSSNPDFVYSYEAPTAHWFNDGRRVKLDEWVDRRHTTTMPSYRKVGTSENYVYDDRFLTAAQINDRANHTSYSHSTHTNTNSSTAAAFSASTPNSILTTSTGELEDLNYSTASSTGVTRTIGQVHSISGNFELGTGIYNYGYNSDGSGYDTGNNGPYNYWKSGSGQARSRYTITAHNTSINNSITDPYSGVASLNKITNADYYHNPNNVVNVSGRTTTNRDSSSIIKIDSAGVAVSNSSFSISTGQTNDANSGASRAGIRISAINSGIGTSTFHINAPTSTGISVETGTTSGNVTNGNTFNVYGSNSNGITTVSGTTFNVGGSSGSTNTFNVAGGNNGILNAGTLTVGKNKFDLNPGNPHSGVNAVGIKNTGTLTFSGVSSDNDRSVFDIGYTYGNGIQNSGTVTFNNESRTYFDITGGNSNGIYSTGGSITLAQWSSGATFDVTGGSSNGIFASAGSVSIGSGTFNVKGSNENTGVLSTGGTVSSTSGTFNLDGYYQTGIRVHNASTSVNSISSTFKLKTGSHNVGLYIDNNSIASDSSIYDIQTGNSSGILVKSGSKLSSATSSITIGALANPNTNLSSNGIFMENGSTLTGNIDGTFNVYSANSNGVRFNNKITTTIGGTYTVSGNNSNGIYFGDTTATGSGTPTIRGGSTFTVSGTGATGVYADNLTSLTVNGGSNTTYPTRFDVSGGVNSSGLLIQKVPTVTIKGVTEFTVEKSSIGIAIDNTDHDIGNRDINFEGEAGNIATSTPAKPVTFKVGTDTNSTKNIGINIQNDGVYGNSIKIDGRTKTFDMKVGRVGVSGHNVGINNSAGVNKLTILQSAATMPPSTNTGSGEGVLEIVGDNNIGFANLGYIAQSDGIKFGSVEINGNRNIGMFFASNTSGNQLNTTNNVGRIGWVNKDTVIDLQGVIGGVSSTQNSFGVYAVSGQSAEGNQGMTGAGPAATAVKDLQVNLNMGVGYASDKSVLVYAGKGTGVTVTSNYATTNSNSEKTISDGNFLNNLGVHKWGYATDENNSSTNTTIAYADGLFKDTEHKVAQNGSGLEDHNSIVKLMDHVDMVSRRGIAFRAENGGKVYMGISEYSKNASNTADPVKHTRAAGYQSVIGYAAGSEGVTNPSANNNNLRKYSNVEINGDIVAADSNILNRERYSGLTGSQATKVSRIATYKNLGAYAAGGGSVNIKTANVSTTAVEGKYSVKHADATNASLVYGMAAYATGMDPKTTQNPNGRGLVTTQNSSIDYAVTNSKGVGVVTGEDGALYAEYGGQIGFLGNIVNQNNIGRTVVTGQDYEFFGTKIGASKALAMNAATAANVSTRNGKGDDLGVTNDHTNTTPFFVERTDLVDSNNLTIYKDVAAIAFKGTTNIDMYDGVLLTGNHYYYADNSGKPQVIDSTATNMLIDGTTRSVKKVIGDLNGSYSDYYTSLGTSNAEETNAKYRGMNNVNVAILGNIDLGLINGSNDLKWDQNQNRTAATGYLGTIANYAGMASIKNDFTSNTYATTGAKGNRKTRQGGGFAFTTSVLNSKLEVDYNINLEDNFNTKSTAADRDNDPFNDIKMESTLVTINTGKNVTGDIASGYRAGQGLSMANSLYRWSEKNSPSAVYRRSNTDESGYRNFGTINVWGGTNKDGNVTNITAVNVANGIVANGDGTKAGVIKVDHGNAIVGTDGSILSNAKDSEITVTGIYTAGGTISALRTSNGFDASSETAVGPTGNNYGIVGISTKNVRDAYNTNNSKGRYGSNAVTISNTDGKITVEGNTAVGIYAQNTTYSGDTDVNTYNGKAAKQEDVRITYDNLQSTTDPSLIKVNSTTALIRDNKTARGIGIALDHDNSGTVDDATRRGGKIHLNTQGNNITAANNKADILTSHNGIGIYAESAEITFGGNTAIKGLNVETKNRGIGVLVTDDSSIATSSDRVSGASTKKLYYNYTGDNNSQGYAVGFGSTLNREGTTNTWATTTATNYLDIEFANTGATKEGIAGLLVNTDNTDTAVNYGHIKEHNTTVTNEKEYGAIVNRGRLVNYGEIKLNDSLNKNAKDVTTDDLKKVNIGILANDHTTNARYNTFIENYNDITIGDVTAAGNKNVGNFAIYGYNVKTGKKSDGSDSIIRISRNNNGIYSGDGNVDIQRGTKLFVGNDTVLGHIQHSWTDKNGVTHLYDRQTQYTAAQDLLPGRETDAAYGVYIGSNERFSNANRNVNVSADMDIDRFSYGIVVAENKGNATTTINIGDATFKPTINLASNKVAGGQVHSVAPNENPKANLDYKEQGNAVYYYSDDSRSHATTYANVTMNGDYNTAYYTRGSVINYGNIDLTSKYDIDKRKLDPTHKNVGYANVGIISSNTVTPSINYGTITTGLSDTQNMLYSVGMGAGRNEYEAGEWKRSYNQGYVINNGTIIVQEEAGIGMFATGKGSKAINNGTIELRADNSIGMYLDQGAIGENHGTIIGNKNNLKGVLAINGGYIKNYGRIDVLGQGSTGIVTDGSQFTLDNSGNVTKILSSEDSEYNTSAAVTAGKSNGHGGTDLYGGTESSIEEGSSGNPKTTGVGTTITRPGLVPLTKITVDGVDTPIFNVETDAVNAGDWARNITISSSIQTGGTRIIDLHATDEWGKPLWAHHDKQQLSEITRIGMYVDTSGVRYTNPVNGIENLPKLSKVDLYFGPEATLYTNSKAIRIGDRVDENGNVIKSNMLKPFNDALSKLSGGTKINPLSSSLTWQVSAKLDDNNQLTEVYMSKVPYHSFAFDDDKSLVNFTNNLDNIYEIARPHSNEKVIFNKLNSIGNGEGHVLAQAFDQMRGHIYGGVQQRIKATSDIIGGEINGLRKESNGSKDSNKFKAFGQRNEFKTDTAGMPDWYSNAGGFVYVHEDETVRLGENSGWYAGAINNYFTFRDLSRSYENQAMVKVGAFKQIPLDENGTLTLSIGGDGFFGRTDTKRKFWVIDQEFSAKSGYYTYGAGANAALQKAFVINEGFSIVPNLGIKAEYGRFSGIHETGDMALNVKSDDYISLTPNVGIDFKYSQPVFKNTNFTAILGFTYENEIGKVNSIENKARIVGAWTDYYTIKGDKEDKRGNLKSYLNLGLDNGRLGFTLNTGYETKGNNFKAGLGLKVLY